MAGEAKRVPSALCFDTLDIADKAAGGSIGTAATTVDLYGFVTVNQTTAGQTLTFPTPTVTTAGLLFGTGNRGTQAFTYTSTGVSFSLAAGASALFFWTGAAWAKVA